jgi:hypothetical protein
MVKGKIPLNLLHKIRCYYNQYTHISFNNTLYLLNRWST